MQNITAYLSPSWPWVEQEAQFSLDKFSNDNLFWCAQISRSNKWKFFKSKGEPDTWVMLAPYEKAKAAFEAQFPKQKLDLSPKNPPSELEKIDLIRKRPLLAILKYYGDGPEAHALTKILKAYRAKCEKEATEAKKSEAARPKSI